MTQVEQKEGLKSRRGGAVYNTTTANEGLCNYYIMHWRKGGTKREGGRGKWLSELNRRKGQNCR